MTVADQHLDGEAKENRRGFLRFRLRTLLLLPLVFAIGWWWVTWPGRTAASFVDAVVQRNGDLARSQMAAGHTDAHALSWLFRDKIKAHDEGESLEFLEVKRDEAQRSFADYLYGRQPIRLSVSWTGMLPNDPNQRTVTESVSYWFIARRGEIVPNATKPQPVAP